MQRPRSEGQRAQQRAANRASLDVSASCDLERLHDDNSNTGQSGQPRRPQTTPKARVRKYLLGPGQAHAEDARRSIDTPTSSFMTHLPDSPPRPFVPQDSARSVDSTGNRSLSSVRANASDDENDDDGDKVGDESDAEGHSSFRDDESDGADEAEDVVSSGVSSAASNAASQASDTEEERDEVFGGCEGPVHEDIPATDEPPEPCEGMDRSPSKMDANINDDDIAYASAFTAIEENPFVDALGSAAEDPVDFGDEERGDNTDGDVDLLETSLVESLVKRNGLSTDQLMVEEALDDCDSDFREILEARQRMEADELNRLQTRQELESYVTSLAGKTDESGQQLVQFPKNFQRIVALMTAADLREEGERSKTPGPVQKSWSEVLIQTSLLKQQAYGSLDEDTDGKTDEQNELESKIAMKIARIRQLDAVLEQKLGKSLYSTIGAVKKKLPATAQSAKPTGLTGRTFVTQPPPSASKQSVTNDTTGPRMFESSAEPQDEEAGDEPRRNAGKRKNFIERNMKIIESSGKSKWTLDEELRLGRLLDQTTETIGEAAAAPSTDTNAFALQDADRFAIDNLIASNQGKYEPIVAFLDKQAANDETRDLVADRNLAPDVRHAGARKPNVIQASKTDRLVAQRLHRIDEELRFLREHENLDIVADDEAAAMDQDDCVSVSSFASRSSISSAASTRSCISRSEFQNFMRSQVQQQGGDPSAKTASPEEIRRLLLSLNRGHSAAPSTVRTVTSS